MRRMETGASMKAIELSVSANTARFVPPHLECHTNERHFRLSWDSQDGTNLNPCCKREVCDGFGGFVAG